MATEAPTPTAPPANGVAAPLPNTAARETVPPAAPKEAPTVDVSGLVTELERTKTGLKGLRAQFEDTRTKTQARDKAIEALRAGGDPEAILAAAEAAGIDAKVIENYLLAASSRKETPEQRDRRELDKRLKAVEERDRQVRNREEQQETETTLSELSASLAEEIKTHATDFPLLAKVPEESARDLVTRAAVWRAEQIAAGEEPSFEDFSAKVNELALEDEREYVGGVVDTLSMMDKEAAQQNKPLVEALANLGFVPQKDPAGEKKTPAVAATQGRTLTDDLAAERGGAVATDDFSAKVARAQAREAEISRRS